MNHHIQEVEQEKFTETNKTQETPKLRAPPKLRENDDPNPSRHRKQE